jgi:hypothetical protein
MERTSSTVYRPETERLRHYFHVVWLPWTLGGLRRRVDFGDACLVVLSDRHPKLPVVSAT